MSSYHLGLKVNGKKIAHFVIQVGLIGLLLGLTRTTLPALAETDFGVPADSYLYLSTFVFVFGLVKGVMNLYAGQLADRFGRIRVLLVGWCCALPIPFMVAWGPTWGWVIAAMILLGFQQGFCWSMSQTAKLDLIQSNERGMVIGINEFAGYLGVAISGIVISYVTVWVGLREGFLILSLMLIVVGILLTFIWGPETIDWASHQVNQAGLNSQQPDSKQQTLHSQMSFTEVFKTVSWQSKPHFAVTQAGLIEKFVDALVWVLLPIYLVSMGLSLPQMGWIIGVYGVAWGGSQFITGKLSDVYGRQPLNVLGMLLCGLGAMSFVFWQTASLWTLSSLVTGVGMAMLYPNLSAAMADLSQPSWRATAIGVYRFWRDLGYAVGAVYVGLIAWVTGSVAIAIVAVAVAMWASTLVLILFGKETLPSKIR